MARPRATDQSTAPEDSPAFLLSQVGAHASAKFAERLVPLGLKPAHVGILRVLGEAHGLSQQALGERLGVFPSRLVGLLDDLGRLGLVERRDSPSDRRSYALHLTAAGGEALGRIWRTGLEHQDLLCAALNASERKQLAGFLARIAAQQGLTPGVHPGYRGLGDSDPRPS